MATHPLPRILVTSFEAFGDDPSGQGLNPSAMVVRVLDAEHIAKHRVVAAVLPCVFGKAITALQSLITQHRPSVVLCLGQAGGASGIRLERVAINLDDAPIADNAGVCLREQPVIVGAPTAYFSSLPLKAMHTALLSAGVHCELSASAGSFVCNHVFFGLMHTLRRRKATGGFIHLPYLPQQAVAPNMPSMTLDEMLRGVRVALHAAVTSPLVTL